MRIAYHLVAAAALLGPEARELSAQQHWGLSLEHGVATFQGHAGSVGTSPETSGHPSSTRTWALRIDRTGRRISFSVGAMVAGTGVEFESDDASVEARNILELIELTPEMAYLLFRPREAPVRLHAGLVIDRWSPEGAQSRTTLGALGAISLEVPLSSRLGMTVRWQGTVTGSVFDADDLPPGFERKNGWSERWVVGGRYRL